MLLEKCNVLRRVGVNGNWQFTYLLYVTQLRVGRDGILGDTI